MEDFIITPEGLSRLEPYSCRAPPDNEGAAKLTFLPATRRRIIAGFAALAAAWISPARAQLAEAKLEPAIAAYLDPLLKTHNFSGVILVAEGERILFEKGYGHANVEQGVSNTPATLFQVASVSKPFTAAAILLLAEGGKVDLRAPVTRILPDYPNGGKLTLHHLLTHSSGIPNINAFPDFDEIQRRPHRPAELVELFKAKPLEFEPGARYSYSNSNYNLLALIIEKVSGESYGAFLEREIFRPLKLGKTGHRSPMSKIVRSLADGYAPEGTLGLQRAGYVDWSVKTGNGSLYSDAAGILRFVRALHRGELLDPASVSATFTQAFPNIGYGWFITQANGRDVHHINGRSPGWTAQVDHYVKEDVTVIVLSNLYVSVTTPIARAVGALHFGAPVEPLPPLSPHKLPPQTIAALLGTYQFGPDYYLPNARVRIASSEGELVGEYVGSDYPAFSFIPKTDGKFLIRSFWSPAEFASDADGRVTELKIDEFRGRRVEGTN
jgi:CubicO group peptidase (beta-lactamase class C family)